MKWQKITIPQSFAPQNPAPFTQGGLYAESVIMQNQSPPIFQWGFFYAHCKCGFFKFQKTSSYAGFWWLSSLKNYTVFTRDLQRKGTMIE